MKGILLAGGAGTRLHPLTIAVSKQLMPVYNKPLVYYPLSTLMLAGIREILLISTAGELPRFRALLGTGADLGIELTYAVQDEPNGIAEALIIAEPFLHDDGACLVLGDNIFHGDGLSALLQRIAARETGATIFGSVVRDAQRYGVLGFAPDGTVDGIDEKPALPRSSYAVPGLYFYDREAVAVAKRLTPSARGELEITDVNLEYLRRGTLQVELLGRGTAWLDTGTHESLLQAANFVEALESRQGLLVGAVEEVAYRMGYIDHAQFSALASRYPASAYGMALRAIAQERRRPASSA